MGTGGVVILSDCFETVRCISWYGGAAEVERKGYDEI